MKIAICFSGMIRTGYYASENLRSFLGEYIDHCVFFLHTWRQQVNRPPRKDISEPPTRARVYRPLNEDDWRFITNTFEFKYVKIDDFDSINLPGMEIGPLWLSWYESIKLKQQYEELHNLKFDYVVKLRPDSIFDSTFKLKDALNVIDSSGVFCFPEYFPLEFEGKIVQSVDDVFWISSSEVVDVAVNFVKDFSFKPWPHNYFHDYLISKNIKPVDLKYSYWRDVKHGILREECLRLYPVAQINKCIECDKRIHYPQNVDTNFMTPDEIEELYKKVGYSLN